MARRKKEAQGLLTETELLIMNAVWKRGGATVHEVLDELDPELDFAYNTVSTLLRILEQKKIVEAVKDGRTHIYKPLLKKDHYEQTSLTHVIENVFAGEPTALVRRLLDTKGLTRGELEQIRALMTKKIDEKAKS